MRITPTKDQAIDKESGDSAPIRIFSSGLGIKGNIGSVVVLYCCKNGVETKHVLSYYLGPETRHTVYEAEVAGEIMAQELLYTQTCRFGCHVSIYVDNQASILSTHTIYLTPDTTYSTSYMPCSPIVRKSSTTSASQSNGYQATSTLKEMKRQTGKQIEQRKATLTALSTDSHLNSARASPIAKPQSYK